MSALHRTTGSSTFGRMAALLLATVAGPAGCDPPAASGRSDAPPRPAAEGQLTPLPAAATSMPTSASASTAAGSSLSIGDAVGDVEFRILDGSRPRLQDFSGPVLVNFWATSCVICLEEAPELVALRDRLFNDGYEMISVAMPFDRPDAVLELAEANGWQHPVAIDLDGQVLAAFEPIIGTPTNLLIGADGRLVERYVGRIDPATLERRVRELLDHQDSRGSLDWAPHGHRLPGSSG